MVSSFLKKFHTLKDWFFKLPLTAKIVIVVAFLGIIWFAFSKLTGGRKPETQFLTTKVERGTIVSTVSASGSVISSNFIPINTNASGIVSKVFVKEGDKVYKGQKIAEVELDLEGQQRLSSAYANFVSANNSLATAENNLRAAEASLEKVYDEIKGHDTDETFAMKETRTKAEVARDNAYNSVTSAKANLSTASINYQMVSPIINAPSSGLIGSINVVPGMVLGTYSNQSSTSTTNQNTLGIIVKEGNPLASFNVSEVDIPKVKKGLKATITLDSIPDKTFTGEVVSVNRIGIVSNNVTNYPVIVQFDTTSKEILPNMAANANIIIETKTDVLLVPTTAIQSQAGQSFVRVLKNGLEQQVTVEVGLTSDTQAEIISGLSEGEEVITGTLTSQTRQARSPIFGGGGFGGGGAFRPGGFGGVRR